MKPPKGAFWAWTDIGSGLKWHLCLINWEDSTTPMIKYLGEDFEDYWYDDDWKAEEIVEIQPPAAREEE